MPKFYGAPVPKIKAARLRQELWDKLVEKGRRLWYALVFIYMLLGGFLAWRSGR